jgi:photosystem II stability/assembly factor-like uncharacterized protein
MLLLAAPVLAGDDDATPAAPGFNAVWSDGAGNAWAVGDFGAVAETVDGGQTWHTVALPTKESLLAVWRAPGGSLFVAGQQGTVLRRERSGRRWTSLRVDRNILTRLEYHRASFEFRGIAGNDREIYLVGGEPNGGGAICLHALRDATMLAATFPCQVDNPFGVWGHGRALFVRGGIFDCHGGDYSALDHSTDGGRHWKRLPPTWNEWPSPLWLTAGGATFELDPDGTVTRQQDGLHADQPTTQFKTGRQLDHRGIWADDKGEIYIVGAGYVVLHSRDSGKTFGEVRVAGAADGTSGTPSR